MNLYCIKKIHLYFHYTMQIFFCKMQNAIILHNFNKNNKNMIKSDSYLQIM